MTNISKENKEILSSIIKEEIVSIVEQEQAKIALSEFEALKAKSPKQFEHDERLLARVLELQKTHGYNKEAHIELKTLFDMAPKLYRKSQTVVDAGTVFHKKNSMGHEQKNNFPEDMTELSEVYQKMDPLCSFSYDGNDSKGCHVYKTKNSMFDPQEFIGHNKENLLGLNNELGFSARDTLVKKVNGLMQRDYENGYTASIKLI
ncbi:MAG: hypothetical protein ACRCXT_00510 [Paraclostridium sp.]